MTRKVQCPTCKSPLLFIMDRTIAEPFIVKTDKDGNHCLYRMKPDKTFDISRNITVKAYCPKCKKRFYSLEHSVKIRFSEDRLKALAIYDKPLEESDFHPSDGPYIGQDLKVFFVDCGLELTERPRT